MKKNCKKLVKEDSEQKKYLRSFGRNINVKVDLSNYATKTVLKNATHGDTSNLASLKTEDDRLNIVKLAKVPVELSKLTNVVKNDVIKKTVYDKLAAKVNNIDTGDFVLKSKYDTDKTELKRKLLILVVLLKNRLRC